MRVCEQELPRDSLGSLASDVGSLKRELRGAAVRETEEVRSRMRPGAAHKVGSQLTRWRTVYLVTDVTMCQVYAWRGLLEERQPKSHVYSCTKVRSTQGSTSGLTRPCVKVPSEVYMPDKTSHLLNLFHKEHSADVTSVRRVRGRYQSSSCS